MAFTGRAVLDVFLPEDAHSPHRAAKNVKGGNLGQPLPGADVPATREAAGVPSAWSQSFPVAPARPRRWCDAGPPPKWRRTRRPGLRDAIIGGDALYCSVNLTGMMYLTGTGSPLRVAGS